MALKSNGKPSRQHDPALGEVEVMGERVAHHFGLLMDFLGHEVAMVALVDQQRRALERITGRVTLAVTSWMIALRRVSTTTSPSSR